MDLFFVLVFVVFLKIEDVDSQVHRQPTLFDFYRKQKLILPSFSRTQTTQVKTKMGCFTECVRNVWCQAVNFKIAAESNGLHVCELLSSDRFTMYNTLKDVEDFEHFNLKV